MEKVVIINGLRGIGKYQADNVNEYLEKGWIVKSVTMSSEEEYTTAIFVLQNDDGAKL